MPGEAKPTSTSSAAGQTQKQDFVRGIAVLPIAGLACGLTFWLGLDSRGWASHGWTIGLLLPLLAGSVIAVVGTIWALVLGLKHKTFKISVVGLLLGLLLVRVVIEFA